MVREVGGLLEQRKSCPSRAACRDSMRILVFEDGCLTAVLPPQIIPKREKGSQNILKIKRVETRLEL